MSAHVPLPDITFADGTPVSASFDDVYFSKQGGIAETEHVFLRGNALPERWTGRTHFTIGELGFGTGLNFLVAWRAFVQSADAGAQLHYIAIEKFPLTAYMLRNALGLQPELAAYAALLIAAYPLRLPGLHRIHLPRVTLTLCYGDAAELLPQLNTPADAWFLDGFSPAKNPAMWDDVILRDLGRLSAPGASFATFTAAGAVKRGLVAQGFHVRKVPGYGRKREMLVGEKIVSSRQSSVVSEEEGQCADKVNTSTSTLGEVNKRRELGEGLGVDALTRNALILGAGIAGCTLARALAERGYDVTVLERASVASGASGNEAAVLFPQLSKKWHPAAAWYFAGYDFMLRQLARWQAAGLAFSHAQPGMLRLPRHAAEEAQLRALNQTLGLDPAIVHWVERDAASAQAGVALTTGGAWFSHGTWLAPAELCRALLQHPRITLHEHAAATLLRKEANWIVEIIDGRRFTSKNCCVAASHESAAFLAEYGVKLHEVGGQVSMLDAAQVGTPLRSILCHKGYVIPRGNHYLIGATYNHDDASLAMTDENHQRNLAEVENFLPGWVHGAATGGRTSLRATTPDRLPYVGQLAEGLYVSTGHGSRGMLSAPLAAEAIASHIAGEHVPLTAALRRAVNPLRFA